MHGLKACLLITAGLLLAGCTTTPETHDPGDPLESFNREVFAMNQSFDHAFLLPVARGYVDVVPEPARNGVHNFVTNLNAPVVFANDMMQGEVGLAGKTVVRFGLNSSLGLGGLVDLATPAGIEFHDSDFGQTLGVWGVGDGPYLVLPLFGPNNPRDLAGLAADIVMDPLTYVGIRDYVYWGMGEYGLVVLDTRARNITTVEELEKGSVDLYASERSLYRQYRENKIRHGKADVKDLPDM